MDIQHESVLMAATGPWLNHAHKKIVDGHGSRTHQHETTRVIPWSCPIVPTVWLSIGLKRAIEIIGSQAYLNNRTAQTASPKKRKTLGPKLPCCWPAVKE